MSTKKNQLIFILIFFLKINTNAQVGYGTNTPHSSSVIEVASATKGILIPRINLTDAFDVSTINNPVNSLTIFNLTETSGLMPGFYYYREAPFNRWLKFGNNPWALTGNSNINANFDFLGTVDDQDLVFKRKDQIAGLINYNRKNTSFGVTAFYNMSLTPASTAENNVAIGYESLKSNDSGNANVAVGSQSLSINNSGNDNVAFGYRALYSNYDGNRNIAVGALSLVTNGSGNDNIANGYEALRGNTTGSYNVAIGYRSLYGNTVGNNNIGLGKLSLYYNIGNNNIGIGNSSLHYNNGSDNVAIGNNSLFNNTTGNENVAIGSFSLYRNNIGNGNTAFGYESLNNSAGSYNTGFGFRAGYNLIGGNNNIAFGANTDFVFQNANYQLNIANIIFGTGLNGSVNVPAGNIGIATALPNSTLEVAGSVSAKIRAITTQGEVAQDNDHTILLPSNYNLGLPDPSPNNEGRIYYVVNISSQSHAINTSTTNNYFRDSGVNFNTITLDTTAGSRGLMVQSNGTYWIIVNKY